MTTTWPLWRATKAFVSPGRTPLSDCAYAPPPPPKLGDARRGGGPRAVETRGPAVGRAAGPSATNRPESGGWKRLRRHWPSASVPASTSLPPTLGSDPWGIRFDGSMSADTSLTGAHPCRIFTKDHPRPVPHPATWRSSGWGCDAVRARRTYEGRRVPQVSCPTCRSVPPVVRGPAHRRG